MTSIYSLTRNTVQFQLKSKKKSKNSFQTQQSIGSQNVISKSTCLQSFLLIAAVVVDIIVGWCVYSVDCEASKITYKLYSICLRLLLYYTRINIYSSLYSIFVYPHFVYTHLFAIIKNVQSQPLFFRAF